MRKVIILFIGFISLTTLAKAQSEAYQNNLTLGMGVTTLGVIKTAVEGALLGESNISSVPNIEIAYDKGITEWFSIGIIGAYQSLSISEDYFGYENSFTLSRTVVAASFMFHYANKGKVDFYSGFRIGFKDWSYNATIGDVTATDNSGLENLSVFGTGFSPQLTLFGIRGYLTDNIGIGMEVLSLGAPHITSFNLNYRF